MGDPEGPPGCSRGLGTLPGALAVFGSCAAAPAPALGAAGMLCAGRLGNGSVSTQGRCGLALHGSGHTHTQTPQSRLGSAAGCDFGSLGEGAEVLVAPRVRCEGWRWGFSGSGASRLSSHPVFFIGVVVGFFKKFTLFLFSGASPNSPKVLWGFW